MEKFYLWLVDVLTEVAGFAVAMIFVAVISESISRNLFSYSFPGAFELSVILMVYVAFIGAAAAFGRHAHFVIFDLAEKLPKSRAIVVRYLVDLITIGFIGLLGYYGFNLALQQMGNLTAGLRIPVGIIYLSLPVFSAFSLILILLRYLLPADLRYTIGKQKTVESA